MEDDVLNFVVEEGSKPYNIRHRCFYFAKKVVLFVKECTYEKVYSSLFDQLIRSGTSIGANVVEGRSGSSKKDWKNFYTIALKSANETKYWLCLIRDTMDVPKPAISELITEADELSNIIASIIIQSNE